jgi:hypothetical protein
MTFPLFFGPNPGVETPMPEENILTFLLRRFRRDLERGLQSALSYEVPVVILGTHTDYIDPETQIVGFRPLIDARTNKAIVPACAVADIQIHENRIDRSNAYCHERVQIVNEDQEFVGATRIKRPPILCDLNMGIRLFHERTERPQSMVMAFRRHFMRHPYLFVPRDPVNRDGDNDENTDEMAHRFMTGQDVSEKGMIFEQFVPFDTPFGSFRSGSSRDNLVVADSQVTILAVPFSDDFVIGDFEDLNTIEIVLYDKDDPEEAERARITIPEG